MVLHSRLSFEGWQSRIKVKIASGPTKRARKKEI
jgi:hypothetical protein